MTVPSGALVAGYDALRTTVAVHPLERDVLRVWGPDALTYLQGQCSQDVAALRPGETAEALLLSPQGKVDAAIRVTRTGDEEFVVDADAGSGDAVEARLARFKLRVEVELERLAWACLAVRGPLAATVATVATGPDVPPYRLAVDWPGLEGFDLLGPPPAGGAEQWVSADVIRCGDAAWDAARIEAGVPVAGLELTEGTIPAEVGLVARTVSFTKGCFTGQELVARLDSRGSNVARRLCGIVVTPEADGAPGGRVLPPAGSSVHTADGVHEVGRLTSVAWSPRLGSTVALAVVHRRVSPPEAVTVRWEADGTTSERAAEARPLPLAR